jgi:acetyl esterase/lipase
MDASRLTWAEFLKRPRPTRRPERVRYGPDPNHIIDLWRPDGRGPHPVVGMIHGGCWQASVASLHLMDRAAADLAARGVAVWNIEYRRVDQPGGGFPGTFEDVAAALDALHAKAEDFGLRGGPLVLLGHSAGGHLALWAAGRRRIAHRAPTSPLAPLAHGAAPVRAVIDLAGIPDLEADTTTACGPEPIHALTGAASAGRPDVYADTSPAELLPLGAELFVIHGAHDDTVPPAVGSAFAARARAAGDRVRELTPAGGHVEEIAPGCEAWEVAARIVLDLVQTPG